MTDDDETVRQPRKPAAAYLSPWSPSEQAYPRVDPGRLPLIGRSQPDEPTTPPPMYPPPRVYVPETPLRGGLVLDRDDEWDRLDSDPFGDPKDGVDKEVLTQSLKRRQKELERELRREGIFIIGDDEWDSDSDTGSLYSVLSTPK